MMAECLSKVGFFKLTLAIVDQWHEKSEWKDQ